MDEVDGHPPFSVEGAAQVAGPHPLLGEIKSVGEVRLGHPGPLTGGKVGAGEGCVVRAHPTAKGNLSNYGHQEG